jgi:hypothetical protein
VVWIIAKSLRNPHGLLSPVAVGTMSREESSRVLSRMKDEGSGLRLVYVTPEKIAKRWDCR